MVRKKFVIFFGSVVNGAAFEAYCSIEFCTTLWGLKILRLLGLAKLGPIFDCFMSQLILHPLVQWTLGNWSCWLRAWTWFSWKKFKYAVFLKYFDNMLLLLLFFLELHQDIFKENKFKRWLNVVEALVSPKGVILNSSWSNLPLRYLLLWL